MNGMIDSDGVLCILRNGVYKRQRCVNGDSSFDLCSDVCPLFGEPEKSRFEGGMVLDICYDEQLFFDEGFEDLRRKG